MKKQFRSKIKEDEFRSGMSHVFDWVGEHWQETRNTVIALAVVALAALGVSQYRQQRADEAARALSAALATFHAPEQGETGDRPVAPGATTYADATQRLTEADKQFTAAAERFGATPDGRQALYYAGLSRMHLGRLDDAEAALRQVIGESSDDPLLASLARLSLAEVERERGNADAAVAAYRELADDGNLPYPRDVPMMRLAAALESAGRDAEAGAAYRRLVEEFPDSVFAAEARRRADYLGSARG